MCKSDLHVQLRPLFSKSCHVDFWSLCISAVKGGSNGYHYQGVCDFKASKEMPTKPEVSPWPQSPSQHLCVGVSGQGWEQGCSRKVS